MRRALVCLNFCGCEAVWHKLKNTLKTPKIQMSTPPEATRHHNLTKLLILLPLRSDLLCNLHYETPCIVIYSDSKTPQIPYLPTLMYLHTYVWTLLPVVPTTIAECQELQEGLPKSWGQLRELVFFYLEKIDFWWNLPTLFKNLQIWTLNAA